MPKYSKRSLDKLNTCHKDLIKLFETVIECYDCSILEGHRSNEKQEQLFHEGRSKVRAGKSKHNSLPSQGIDVAPYPIDWNNTKRFYHFAGYVKGIADSLNIRIRWGGDWDGDNDLDDQSFMDLVHFEIKN